jgi:hypothetical protein
LTFGKGPQRKPQEAKRPAVGSLPSKRQAFVEMSPDNNHGGSEDEEDEDFKPVIVGEDFGINLKTSHEQRSILAGKPQVARPNRDSSSESEKKPQRRRHDSDASSSEDEAPRADR